jgi:hypothetical protein
VSAPDAVTTAALETWEATHSVKDAVWAAAPHLATKLLRYAADQLEAWNNTKGTL